MQFSENPMTPQEETVILEARDILDRYLSQNPVIGSWQALMDYCALTVRGPIERFHVLYLDRKNRVISDELLSTGTVDHVPVYPREVIKRALMLNASALILIHNHPSGDPTPSEADLSMTKEIQKGCKYLGLTLHDHIIVGAGTELSLRALGKLRSCQQTCRRPPSRKRAAVRSLTDEAGRAASRAVGDFPMFDLPLPIHPTTGPRGFSPVFAVGDADPNHPFALTLSRRTPADLMSGRAAPLVLARFATLAEAMQGAIDHAVAWCHPVTSAAEARGVVTEASQMRAQAGRAAAWGEPDLAVRLRQRADLLDARLVDPLPPGRCSSRREAPEAEKGRGDLELVRGREKSPRPAPIPSPYRRHPMTLSEPTLAPPMAPSTVDMAQIFAAHAERAARIEALRPGNKDRLFDGLTVAGITHVTVTFDGAGDSGQIESIGACSGDTAVEFPATEIEYAALTWDDPEVEMRQLSLEDVVEQLAYDFLSDTHSGWENNDGASGEFCFDAAARCIHLEFNERFTSSELFTHDF